jgi:Tn3 transposase DDE domain
VVHRAGSWLRSGASLHHPTLSGPQPEGRHQARDEQQKFIKYNHLVSNLLVFHNLVSMTRAMGKMEADGYPVSDELVASLSPYPTEHINRFGNYNPKFGRAPEPIVLQFRKPPQMETMKVLVMPSSSQPA